MWLSLKLTARTRKTCNIQNLRRDSDTSINMHKTDIQDDVFWPGGYGALDREMCCHNSNIRGGNTAITRRHKYPLDAFKIFDVRRRDRMSRNEVYWKLGFIKVRYSKSIQFPMFPMWPKNVRDWGEIQSKRWYKKSSFKSIRTPGRLMTSAHAIEELGGF